MIRILYYVITVWLAVYGIQSLVFTALFLRHRREQPQLPSVAEDSWPSVAIQLPIFNERHVVERLIDAAACLDYPGDRLEVQVLDDSTDETSAIAEARAAYHRARGINVQVIHRSRREGFKAGALAFGLEQTRAEFLAIFDADFRPDPDFLRRVIPYFVDRPTLGIVQTRWGHLNDVYSPLTRAQALVLDGQFVVEQVARNRSGLLMPFNGSGGVWRRQAIASAGGWQSDTMNEDMDLSYRAHLAGWDALYLPNIEAPGELPPQLLAFKQQQARWACGSMQCLRKLGPSVVRSDLTFAQKLTSILHMGGYLTQPLFILLLLASLPIMVQSQPMPAFFAFVGLAGFGPPLIWAIAQRTLYHDWKRRLLYLPVLALVNIGIAVGTTRAVYQGLTHWGGTFRRTPKFRLEGRQGAWSTSLYKLMPDRVIIVEFVLAFYAAATCVVAWSRGEFGALPFLLVYVLGFGTVAWVGVLQSVRH
ncbi:MAG TPA: glycosyltransferase [Anaerolineae bacterium]